MNLEEVIGCFLWIETGNSSPICCGVRHKHIDFDLTFLELLKSVIIILYVPFGETYMKLFGYWA